MGFNSGMESVMGIATEQEKLAVLGLSLVPEIGPRRFKNLIDRFGSACDVLAAPAAELGSVEDIPLKAVQKIGSSRVLEDAQKEIENAAKSGVSITSCFDPAYPQAFKNIPDSPIVIYTKGNIIEGDVLSVAIVGTRRPTSYGKAATEKFAKELSGLGVTIVSGLARGIDTEAHSASLAVGGRTIAVLGNGLNKHYPPENRKLEEKIAGCGALISEFAMDEGPDRGNFPRRNRLISAFSLATLVVEAGETSGALITAKYCAEQGKDVFALPGPVFSKYSKGPHMLIKQGAHLVESAADIIEEIKPLAEAFARNMSKTESCPQPELFSFEGVEEKIMNILEDNFNGVSADRLSTLLNMPANEVFPSLTTLEIKGFIKCLPGKTYVKNMEK